MSEVGYGFVTPVGLSLIGHVEVGCGLGIVLYDNVESFV
jgi:hypothetical protein